MVATFSDRINGRVLLLALDEIVPFLRVEAFVVEEALDDHGGFEFGHVFLPHRGRSKISVSRKIRREIEGVWLRTGREAEIEERSLVAKSAPLDRGERRFGRLVVCLAAERVNFQEVKKVGLGGSGARATTPTLPEAVRMATRKIKGGSETRPYR